LIVEVTEKTVGGAPAAVNVIAATRVVSPNLRKAVVCI
jgi:hypothetical protein